MDIEKLKQAFADIKRGMSALGGGPADYYIDHLMECRDEFFARCAPFQLGDTVEITRYPDINNGWESFRHSLVPGARGEVREVDFRNGLFIGAVKIFNQTWLDDDGKERQTENLYLFTFDESYLRKVE